MSDLSTAPTAACAITQTCREEHGRVMAALVAWCRDFDLASDALQDAYARALDHWPREGTPSKPAAWLLTTARRRVIDGKRRASNFQSKVAQLTRETGDMYEGEPDFDEDIPDERLRLIFTCAHPAIAARDRVALTLRTLAGLTTEELARAFLTKPSTMAQRLVRVQRKIRDAGIPYRVPEPSEMPERLDGVLSVLYLIFNEGYVATSGEDVVRVDLCTEAIRLTNILASLLPDEPEVRGLLALTLFHHARRGARTDASGSIIALEDQDRSLWSRRLIDAATHELGEAMRHQRAGRYQLQAAISALHCRAPSWAATDWRQIVALYSALYRVVPTPVIALNRAVAVGEGEGADAGLRILEALEHGGTLDDYQPFHAARADLLRRCERYADARQAYARAIALTENEREREFLRRRVDALVPR